MTTGTTQLERVRTPWWRRLTAAVSLGSLIVIMGIGLAIVATGIAIAILYMLEWAVG